MIVGNVWVRKLKRVTYDTLCHCSSLKYIFQWKVWKTLCEMYEIAQLPFPSLPISVRSGHSNHIRSYNMREFLQQNYALESNLRFSSSLKHSQNSFLHCLHYLLWSKSPKKFLKKVSVGQISINMKIFEYIFPVNLIYLSEDWHFA